MMESHTKNMAQELQRRKMLAGAKSTLNQAIAEISFLEKYNCDLTVDNIHINKNITFFAASDTLGQLICVILDEERSWKIIDCGADVYVAASIDDSKKLSWHGWIPNHEIKSMDILEKVFSIDVKYLLPMPNEEFKFITPCKDAPCESSAMWNIDNDCWMCFECDRYTNMGSRNNF